MRSFPQRPLLPTATRQQLQKKVDVIALITDPQEKSTKARSTYASARTSQWFKLVINALRGLCGEGGLCMYCSSNEPSQVEHYRPLSVFPDLAFHYENYLWTCDICNRTYKGERFPPDTEPGAQILNPLEDNVWEYFFLSEQNGRLIRKIDIATNDYVPRATSTCKVVGIDRENVQKKRQHRFRRLRQNAEDALDKFLAGTLSQADLRAEIALLRAEPFQSDVADYFLNGPGRLHEPFRSIFVAIDTLGESDRTNGSPRQSEEQFEYNSIPRNEV